MLIVGVLLAVMLVWFLVSLLFRWRFQFSTRSLLMLVVVVAVPCAWMKTAQDRERQLESSEREALTRINAAGGWVVWSSGNPLGWEWANEIRFDHLTDDELARILPDLNQVAELKCLGLTHTAVTDKSVEHLCDEIRNRKGLPRLYGLYLARTGITDGALRHIEKVAQLRSLTLGETQITDSGLPYLKTLTQLESLGLNNTQISDAGLEHIRDLRQLGELNLGGTSITDASLEVLKGFRQLERLELEGSKVTDKGKRELEEALPHCKIK
jgi:hypothetical protein